MKLSTLRKSASSSTAFRGHKMKWHTPYGNATSQVFSQRGECRVCGMECVLNESPAPNEINVGGEAVAMQCIAPYKSMDEFTTAYVEAALWSSIDDKGEPLDAKYGAKDIALASMLKTKADCELFQTLHGVPAYNDPNYSDAEKAGHDFWLTRNGHGAGFWDRGLGEIGDKFTAYAKAFGQCDIYVGDDGKLHI